MKYLKSNILIVAFFMLVALVLPQQAKAYTLLTDRLAWNTAVGSYAAVSSLDGITNGNTVSSFSLPSGITASSTSLLEVQSIGSGWETWSGGYIGKVLSPNMANPDSTTTTIINFGSAVYAFGFDLEPDIWESFTMTVLLSDGSSAVQDIQGKAGAKFFGWVGLPITSITISGPVNFAFGNMVEQTNSVVPEPASLSLLGLGLLGLFGLKRKK